jgi:hypothetical protein
MAQATAPILDSTNSDIDLQNAYVGEFGGTMVAACHW